jgi:hypothetical protein
MTRPQFHRISLASVAVFTICFVLLVLPYLAPFLSAKGGLGMADAPRISITEARAKTLSWEALLVCAYDSDDKFNQMRLERAISFSEFKRKLPEISKKREIIFYCA